MDPEPLVLPAAPAPPRRQPLPIVAGVVPIAAGVVLWLVTGSLLSLCFAALGPMMIVASLLDGVRTRRRDRRAAAEGEEEAWARVERDLRRRHARERGALRRAHPDAAAAVREPPLRDLAPVDEETLIVVGRGERPSSLRVTGDDGERARTVKRRAAVLGDAPIVVPMRRGICLRGPEPVTAAAARALVVQMCLRHGPSQLSITGDALEQLGLDALPHARSARRGAWRLAVLVGEEEARDAVAQIRLRPAGSAVPEGVTTVIDAGDPQRARLRTAEGTVAVVLECLSRAQARVIAVERADAEQDADELPDRVPLAELMPAGGEGAPAGLPAVIGRSATGKIAVDLVDDGPHAIVIGMTGAGKSELLVSWITAMAAQQGPDRVAFVLADFKGGTAFEPLRELPHVAAIMTDLDEEGAQRGVRSLTAELRRREAVLADAGVRDVAEADDRLRRLVIVVDEFAALLQEHPDLGAVFTDIAARGRALGMHLVLGTQRATGVIRDALAANCPLRISLRVTDAADSRLVIGTDDAAALSGGAASRGLALVRRPQDDAPRAARIALTSAADLRAIAARGAHLPRPESPWLPPLPARLALDSLVADEPDALVLGLVDEPERQRQRAWTMRPGEDRGLAVIGAGGSGRTTLLRTLAAQSADVRWIPADAERAWDAVAELSGGGAAPRLVLCDDVDQIVQAMPVEHAQAFLDALERLVRSAAARGCTVVLSTGRVSGQLARIVDALARRVLLRTGTKMEHLAAGGDPDGYLRDRAPGRGRLGAQEVQIAIADGIPPATGEADAAAIDAGWSPARDTVGVVCTGAGRVVEALRRALPGHTARLVEDAAPDASVHGVLVADAETWQRHWALWQRVRAEGEMLVLAECTTELRSLAGMRALPPYAHPHRGRAWSIVDGRAPRRVVLAGLDQVG